MELLFLVVTRIRLYIWFQILSINSKMVKKDSIIKDYISGKLKKKYATSNRIVFSHMINLTILVMHSIYFNKRYLSLNFCLESTK